MKRKGLKVNYPTAERLEYFERANETQTETIARLLDAAGVPEPRRCNRCRATAFEDVWTPEGNRRCENCAELDDDELPVGGLRE